MENIKEYSITELEAVVGNLGLEKFRASQIFQWLWQKKAKTFSEMTNLSKDLRRLLSEKFTISQLRIEERLKAKDKTEKFLLKLEDNHYIETVFIPESRRNTVCISTQVGCALGCKFCATAQLGFKRNLSAAEIAGQVQIIQGEFPERITNIVFMGMGEPLLNLKAAEKAIEIISSPIGLGISQRHITISTIGLTEGVNGLLKSSLKVKLAISLNFADEEMRKAMMPATKTNVLKELLEASRQYSLKKNMVTFEYVMIDGLNDKLKDAISLMKLLNKIPAKINLIPYNPHPALPYKKPAPEKIERFHQKLLSSKRTVTLRKSRGQEILAGCGQLAGANYYPLTFR